MRKIVLSISLPFLLALILTASPLHAVTRGLRVVTKSGESLSLYKEYYAIVVGVSDYEKWPKLPNAVNDAKEVASKLVEMGFEVGLVLDPTYQELKTALNEMVYKMGRDENLALVFYYAGHGETETLADKTKMGYIIPKDCPLIKRDPLGFAAHAISMRDVESASLRIQSKHVLMLFDSCFSGSLFNLVRAVPEDITEKSALPVRQYITAGRENEQVPDRSMFKRCFLIGLDGDADLTGDGYITGSEMGMYLADKVVNYTHGGQHPQYGKINNPNLDRGDFIFVPVSLEAKLKATEDRLRREIAEKMTLKEELERLKSELAKVPKFEKDQEKPPSAQVKKTGDRIKLAVLPWNLEGFAKDCKYIAINALNQAIIDNQRFVPLFSYYDLGNKLKTKNISDDLLREDVIDDLWFRRSAFSEVEPNIDLICRVGRELQVDVVLMYDLFVSSFSEVFWQSHGHHFMRVFLINLKTKEKYYAKGITTNFDFDGFDQVKSLTEKVFNDFEKYETK